MLRKKPEKKSHSKVIDMAEYVRSHRHQQQPAEKYSATERTAPEKEAKERVPFFGNTGLMSLLVVLIALVIAALISTQVFVVREILVVGGDGTDPENVAGLTGIALEENIFLVDLSRVRENLASDPTIEVVNVSRVYPDKIKVEIVSRIPFAAVPYLGNYIILDSNGIVTQVQPELPLGSYVLLTGIPVSGYALGQPLEVLEPVAMENFMLAAGILQETEALQYVAEVNIENVDRINLLSKEGILVELGTAENLREKTVMFAETMPVLRQRGYTSGVLYILSGEEAVYSDSETAAQYSFSSEAFVFLTLTLWKYGSCF